MKNAPLTTITEGVSDVLSTGTEIVHDLGSSAVELVTGLTRTKRTPWWRRPGWVALIVVALVGAVAIFEWRRRAEAGETSVDRPRERADRAAASAAAVS